MFIWKKYEEFCLFSNFFSFIKKFPKRNYLNFHEETTDLDNFLHFLFAFCQVCISKNAFDARLFEQASYIFLPKYPYLINNQ